MHRFARHALRAIGRSPFAIACALLCAANLDAQSLRWKVPSQGAVVYSRSTQRLSIAPPATSIKIDWVVPSASDGGHEWKCFMAPQNGAPPMWETPSFNDSAWSTGKGEFGTDIPQNPNQRTRWASELLLLRGSEGHLGSFECAYSRGLNLGNYS
jgi:hypothetical protein